MGRPSRFSPEVRERAVRMVEEHREAHASEWAVLQSVAPKLGCTAETLRKRVRQVQRDAGHRPGLTTSERERLKELEREVRELKRANEILRKAFAYFAQAEPRPPEDVATMVQFIADHRDVFGVEPICAVLPIAPSTDSSPSAPADMWVANYYSARNPLRLSSLVILGVVARMFRCATRSSCWCT